MHTIINNKEKSRFEITSVDASAILEYEWSGKDMVLIHTFVSESLRGKGLAEVLARFALEYIREHELKTIVQCPYVTSYLKKHPEYKDIVIAKITPGK